MKNILITGGTGFIARNLKEYLDSKFKVFAPTHSELELLDESKVAKFILKNKIRQVIHCANIGGGRDTVGMPNVVYSNLRMFFSIVQNLDYLEKFIQIGSGAEYNMRNYKPKMTEDYFDKHIPSDDYGFAKYVCAKFIQNIDKACELRLFAVFGKYENVYIKFISNAIVRNLFKLPIVIYQNVYFDFMYISDLVRIMEYFLTHTPQHKSYNITTGKPIDLVTIAEKINKIGKFKSKIVVKNPGLNTEYTGDNSRLLSEIGNFEFTPFELALRDLYSWHEKNLENVDKKKIEEDPYGRFARIKRNG